MPVTSHVQGLRDLQLQLRALPDAVERRVISGGLQDGARVFEKAAEASAPVGFYSRGEAPTSQRLKYGSLVRNIRRRSLASRPPVFGAAVSIGRAFWGVFQEFGTRFVAARPWFRPAWEGSKAAVLSAIVKGWRERFDREVLRRLTRAAIGSRR